MQHRPEIEGLRALAVLPVILFHAGLPWMSGGFVGVDVFFVISGYLITLLLIEDFSAGTFSLWGFYERRARRILPALFLVMACAVPFAYALMTPSQLSAFGRTSLAVLGFVSNIAFWRDHGYFSAAAELNPLLHTWSLAVEEQFYLVFPLFLLVLMRVANLSRTALFWIIALLALASLGLSEWGWRNEPKANFYLTPTRAWELLAGSLLALSPWQNNRKPLILEDILSFLGLAMIAFAIVGFDADTPSPSLWMLVPVTGAGLILVFAQPGTRVARLLSIGPLCAVGAISYGAYLWHQPIFAFARLRSLGDPPLWLMLALSLLAFGLAALSWRYVEQPFRRKQNPYFPRRATLFAALAVVLVGLAGIAGTLRVAKGFPNRSNGDVTFAALDARIAMDKLRWKDCDFARRENSACRSDPRPEVLLWGDSYAQHLAAGLMASDPGLKLQLLTLPACAPVLGVSFWQTNRSQARIDECQNFNAAVLKALEASPQIRFVILAGSFTGPLRGDLVFAQGVSLAGTNQTEVLAFGLQATIAAVQALGRKALVISPPPTHRRNTGNCLLRSVWYNAPEDACDFPLTEAANADALALMDAVERFAPVMRLDRMICPDGICRAQPQGRFIWRDAGHLAVEGAEFLGKSNDWMGQVRKLAQ